MENELLENLEQENLIDESTEENGFPNPIKIKLKRGTKTALDTQLIGDNKPAYGEPVFESDTNKLKIGDGNTEYKDLKYLKTDDDRFNITDTQGIININQILVPKGDGSNQWVNRKHYNEQVLETAYNSATGGEAGSNLTLKGYANAVAGQVPVKGNAAQGDKLVWVTPVSTAQLESIESRAELAKNGAVTAANNAATEANKATNATVRAELAKNEAVSARDATASFLNSKIWIGTLAQYNALTQIDDGKLYFIKPAN